MWASAPVLTPPDLWRRLVDKRTFVRISNAGPDVKRSTMRNWRIPREDAQMTCQKISSTSRYSIDRRSLLKYTAATGAALSTGVYAPAIAQTRAIKLGYVSPQ